MTGFDHERLEVYRVGLEFVVVADEVAAALPPGRAHLADQLQRAATSIALNIAEGAGEFSKKDKARFYRFALRSATECAAVIDICRMLHLVAEKTLVVGHALLVRIVSMLTVLVRRLSSG